MRFHLYWAGSDKDGVVTGYYWAVVETLATPPEGLNTLPQLPGPKARDYRYTTRTDTLITFDASIDVPERQHAFYIYAVDNKGKADPTPARFVFSAYDRFPPHPVIDLAEGRGTTYSLVPGGVAPVTQTYSISDTFSTAKIGIPPQDTVPSNAVLHFHWHAISSIGSTVVTGYRYKLDEPTFNVVDSTVHDAYYNTAVNGDTLLPGSKIFTLQAVGQSGWRGETNRYFQMNFSPDSWFSGPDPTDPTEGWSTYTSDLGVHHYYYKDLLDFTSFQGVPGTMLSSDSVVTLPAFRPQRKTFFEIYNNRIWAHYEGDTVNANSWLIFPSGGFDRDSPYDVKANQVVLQRDYPGLYGAPVLTPQPPNGSPRGFHIRVQTKKGPVVDAAVSPDNPTESTVYPFFDKASVFDLEQINGYGAGILSGKGYAVVRAEDGQNDIDKRIERAGGAVKVADRVDGVPGAGGIQPGDLDLRSKILTFYINHAPTLVTNVAAFSPKANSSVTGSITFRPVGADLDPFDAQQANPHVGASNVQSPILVFWISFIGKTVSANDTTYDYPLPVNAGSTTIIPVPSYFRTQTLKVRIWTCDCATCTRDVTNSNNIPGRCSINDINVLYTKPPEPAVLPAGVSGSTLRPGSASDAGGRQTP